MTEKQRKIRKQEKRYAHVRAGVRDVPTLVEMDRRVPFLPPDVPRNDWV